MRCKSAGRLPSPTAASAIANAAVFVGNFSFLFRSLVQRVVDRAYERQDAEF